MVKSNQISFNVSLGKTIRYYRELSNISRNELAIKSEVNEKYLGKIERGECSASCYILKKISVGLNISLTQLLKDL
jgi:transcriptional regulator with XRE-family HTH domain